MTTNKPHIEAYLVTRIKNEGYGKPRRILDAEIYDPTSDSFFVSGAKENHTVEPLVPLSKYEALQAEYEKLVEALERAHMALIGYLPGHRNDITDAAISQCEQALSAYRNQGGDT